MEHLPAGAGLKGPRGVDDGQLGAVVGIEAQMRRRTILRSRLPQETVLVKGLAHRSSSRCPRGNGLGETSWATSGYCLDNCAPTDGWQVLGKAHAAENTPSCARPSLLSTASMLMSRRSGGLGQILATKPARPD